METEWKDLLDSINAFYETAWNKLIIAGSLAVAIVGVLVPLMIQWWQTRSNRKDEERLKAFLHNTIQNEKEKIQEEIKKNISADFDDKMKQQFKYIVGAGGMSAHIQSQVYLLRNMPTAAMESFCQAVQSYCISEDFINLRRSLDYLDECLQKSNAQQFQEFIDREGTLLNDTLTKVLTADKNGAVRDLVHKMKVQIKNLEKSSGTV